MDKWFRLLVFVFIGFFVLLYVESIFSVRLEHYGPGQYQTDGKTTYEYHSFFGRIVFDNFAALWDWLDRNERPILGIFTILLVIFTGALAFYTGNLWGATKDLVEETGKTTKALEKAYVYGGPGGPTIWKREISQVEKTITIGNYGKTLAFLWKVDWDGCPLSEWKSGQRPNNSIVMRDVLYPQTPPTNRFAIPLKVGTTAHVVWGRVHFRDVFGDRWYSTWEHRMEPSENWARVYPLEHNAEVYPDDETDTHTAS